MGKLYSLLILFFLISTECLDTVTGSKRCRHSSNSLDPVSCRRAGCDYNLVSETCEPAYKGKNHRRRVRRNSSVTTSVGDIKTATCDGLSGCKKNGGYYAFGGDVTKHEGEDQQSCTYLNPRDAWGVNFHQPDYSERTGISYAEMKTETEITKFAGNDQYKYCSDPENFTGDHNAGYFNFLSQAIAGKEEGRGKDVCEVFSRGIDKDGFYELKLFFYETQIDEDKAKTFKRRFNVKLSGIPVLREFSIQDHVQICQVLEVIIEFEVRKKVLAIPGFESINYDNQLQLGFCYGDKDASNSYLPDFLCSGFHVAELDPTVESVTSICSSTRVDHPTARKPKIAEKTRIMGKNLPSKSLVTVANNEDDPYICKLKRGKPNKCKTSCWLPLKKVKELGEPFPGIPFMENEKDLDLYVVRNPATYYYYGTYNSKEDKILWYWSSESSKVDQNSFEFLVRVSMNWVFMGKNSTIPSNAILFTDTVGKGTETMLCNVGRPDYPSLGFTYNNTVPADGKKETERTGTFWVAVHPLLEADPDKQPQPVENCILEEETTD